MSTTIKNLQKAAKSINDPKAVMRGANSDFIASAQLIAETLFPIDDDDPISIEWLIRCRFNTGEDDVATLFDYDSNELMSIWLSNLDAKIWTASFGSDCWPHDLRSRREVRWLCLALGIVLKDTSK